MDSIKKVELHLHMDGSLRTETAKELSINEGLIPEHTTTAQMKRLLSVGKSETDLVNYLKRFDLPLKILQTSINLKRVAYELVEDLAMENTIYAEIRVAPIQHLQKGLTPEEVVQSILEGFRQGEQKYNIKVRLLLCAMRHIPPDDNLFLIDLACKYKDKGVAGLDLAGDEAGYPGIIFKDFFDKAKARGIPFTIHAGEARGSDSITEAINLGAARLGHGIRAYEDAKTLKLIKQKNICLECCPVSNLNTRAIEDFNNYPILDYMEYGLPVTLNTDNRTVSDTTYQKEIDLLSKHLDINTNHIKKFNINAINHAFISNDLKIKLLNQINQGDKNETKQVY